MKLTRDCPGDKTKRKLLRRTFKKKKRPLTSSPKKDGRCRIKDVEKVETSEVEIQRVHRRGRFSSSVKIFRKT